MRGCGGGGEGGGWGHRPRVPTLVYVRGRSSDLALAASRDVGVSLHLVSRQVSQGHPLSLGPGAASATGTGRRWEYIVRQMEG